MRSSIVLSALLALAVAQKETFSFGPIPSEHPTSVINVEPSATDVEPGPINTARACGQIANYVAKSTRQYPAVEAELAYACLKSVPIDKDAAARTVDSLKKLVEFQSTIAYLKEPPKGYINGPVDLRAGLDDIGRKVADGKYDNEYDFEEEIAILFGKSYDGHLNFGGMAYSGTFVWLRDTRLMLLSASKDGKETPKIWSLHDLNQTDAGYTPSAVSKINGEDAVSFLMKESDAESYHDPDTRYNNMFYQMPSDNPGSFSFTANKYPGKSTTVTFENGTTSEYPTLALVQDSRRWSYVEDPETFYQQFIVFSNTRSKNKAKRETQQGVPQKLKHWKPKDFGVDASMPIGYPKPSVEHSAADVPLAGFFVQADVGTVGVLTVPTFNAGVDSGKIQEIEEFQMVVQKFIAEAKAKNVEKIVIDLRTNPGGLVMLGYDTYLQFFPSQKPQLLMRYRATNASNIFGRDISRLSFSEESINIYATPFNVHSYVDSEGKPFKSWADLFGPHEFNGDEFTSNLRYNLSDPLVSSSDDFSIGISLTGYGDRSNFTEDPWKKEDIILLQDGICASTCALFSELMVQQSGVRSIALGGRPSSGPMQAVGGTKGARVYSVTQLTALSSTFISLFADSQTEARDWAEELPYWSGVQFFDASVNFQDNIRKGLERDGIPTQFLNDSATCKVWYEKEDYFDVERLWKKVAGVAFGGKDGALKEDACVEGSVTSDEAQRGVGEGSPTSPDNPPKPSKSKGAAAAVMVPTRGECTMVVTCGLALLGSVVFGAGLI